jgi:hypothetical protein
MPVKQQIGIVISNKTKDYCGKIENRYPHPYSKL